MGRVVEAQFWKLSGAKFGLGMPHATGNYATADCPDSRLPVKQTLISTSSRVRIFAAEKEKKIRGRAKVTIQTLRGH